MAQSLVISLAGVPLLFPLANSSLSSNPSYLLEIPPFAWCDPIHPGPRLLVNWPPPPHSKFPSPLGIPNLIMRPAKTTSRSRLYIVWNSVNSCHIQYVLLLVHEKHRSNTEANLIQVGWLMCFHSITYFSNSSPHPGGTIGTVAFENVFWLSHQIYKCLEVI